MNLNDLLRYKALHFKHVASNSLLVDAAGADQADALGMKNVCAMISTQLFDDLTEVCTVLQISKRTLIEAALIDAIKRAHDLMDEEGVTEILESHSVEV